MSSDKINKNLESQYQYVSPGPTKEGIIPEEMLEQSGMIPIRDELAPSPKMDKPINIPPLDAPELPIPTAKGRKTEAVKRQIAQEAKNEPESKKQRITETNQSTQAASNPWLAYPSNIGTIYAILLELANNMSKVRFSEALVKLLVEEKAFKMGMENADLAEKLKIIAADKEFLRAIGSLLGAATSLYQLKAMAGLQGQAKLDRDNLNTETGQKIKDKRIEITQMEQAAAVPKAGEPLPTDKKALKELVANTASPQAKEDIKKQQDLLQKMEQEHQQEYRETLTRQTDEIRYKGDFLKGISQGVVEIASSLYTRKEGELEKDKARNEALMQIFHKLDDSVSKSKDDAQAQLDKILQQIAQYSSETTRAHQLKG